MTCSTQGECRHDARRCAHRHRHYYVDDVGDVVTELADEGTDRVISTISYTLGENVENLTLRAAKPSVARATRSTTSS